jgi:hypothetical protein
VCGRERRRSGSGDGHHAAVKVAVIAVRMMEVPVNEVIDMVTMRHGGVPAAFTMHVRGIVSAAAMTGGAVGGIGRGHGEVMLFDPAPVGMVQVPIMQIVHMIVVLDGRVTTAGAVDVGVIRVQAHDRTPGDNPGGMSSRAVPPGTPRDRVPGTVSRRPPQHGEGG